MGVAQIAWRSVSYWHCFGRVWQPNYGVLCLIFMRIIFKTTLYNGYIPLYFASLVRYNRDLKIFSGVLLIYFLLPIASLFT
jgi:hypothetical protein